MSRFRLLQCVCVVWTGAALRLLAENALPTEAQEPALAAFANAAPVGLTNAVVPLPNSLTNMPVDALSSSALTDHLRAQLEMARHFRHIRLPQQAEPLLVELLVDTSPE